jgi:hypothetical protein
MREALHWGLELFFVGVGVFAVWAIVSTIIETFGGE